MSLLTITAFNAQAENSPLQNHALTPVLKCYVGYLKESINVVQNASKNKQGDIVAQSYLRNMQSIGGIDSIALLAEQQCNAMPEYATLNANATNEELEAFHTFWQGILENQQKMQDKIAELAFQ